MRPRFAEKIADNLSHQSFLLELKISICQYIKHYFLRWIFSVGLTDLPVGGNCKKIIASRMKR